MVRKGCENMKWMRYVIIAASAVMLSGCAMGGATGEKTVLGMHYLEDEDYQQAQRMFEDAVREGEQETLAYRGLGIAQMGLAQYEQAAESFEMALDAADEGLTIVEAGHYQTEFPACKRLAELARDIAGAETEIYGVKTFKQI